MEEEQSKDPLFPNGGLGIDYNKFEKVMKEMWEDQKPQEREIKINAMSEAAQKIFNNAVKQQNKEYVEYMKGVAEAEMQIGLEEMNAEVEKQKKQNVSKGIYQQLKEAAKTYPIPKDESKDDPLTEWVYKPSHVVTYSNAIYGTDPLEKDEYMKIKKSEYDELKANQKTKEWSDDLVLMDINRLTAFLLDNVGGMKRKHWFNKHKENDLTDEQFDIWDKKYNSLLKFRSDGNV
jgi:hypothetical protein